MGFLPNKEVTLLAGSVARADQEQRQQVKSQQQQQQQQQQQEAKKSSMLMMRRQRSWEEETFFDAESESEPVPPRPSVPYLARLWDNLHGAEAAHAKPAAKSPSRLGHDVKRRLSDGAKLGQMLAEIECLLEGPECTARPRSASAPTAEAANAKAETKVRSGSTASKKVSSRRGPLKRLNLAAGSSKSSTSSSKSKSSSSQPRKAAKAEHPSAAPVRVRSKRSVCPRPEEPGVGKRSSPISPRSVWRAFKRHVPVLAL